jgi:hypothetical protein
MRARISSSVPKFKGGQLATDSLLFPGSFLFDDPDNGQLTVPVRGRGYYEREAGNLEADGHLLWLFKNRLVVVEPPYEFCLEEIVLTVVHVVLSQEREFLDMQREIELFQRLEQAAAYRREPIPKDVRAFVWRRDEGRCVSCGSNERLEFDHIVPVSKGGSSTERNIQLLCDLCNRVKGSSI